MMEHQPPRVLIALLLTCDACVGNTTTTMTDGSVNACHECINGYRSVALPLGEVQQVLSDHTGPLEQYIALLGYAHAHAPVAHPLRYNVTDVPYCFQQPPRREKPA